MTHLSSVPTAHEELEVAMLAIEKFHDRWCRSLPYATVLDLQDVISGGDQLVSCKMCRTPKYRLNNEQVCGQCRFA